MHPHMYHRVVNIGHVLKTRVYLIKNINSSSRYIEQLNASQMTFHFQFINLSQRFFSRKGPQARRCTKKELTLNLSQTPVILL